MQTHSCSALNLPCFWISASNICTSWCWLVESAICAFKLLFDWGTGTCYLNQTWWPSCSFIKDRISLHREKCAKLGFVCLFGKVIIFGIKTQKWSTMSNHAVHTKSDQLACECQSTHRWMLNINLSKLTQPPNNQFYSLSLLGASGDWHCPENPACGPSQLQNSEKEEIRAGRKRSGRLSGVLIDSQSNFSRFPMIERQDKRGTCFSKTCPMISRPWRISTKKRLDKIYSWVEKKKLVEGWSVHFFLDQSIPSNEQKLCPKRV